MNHTIGRRSIILEGLTFGSGPIGNGDNSLTEKGVLNTDTLGNFLHHVAPTFYTVEEGQRIHIPILPVFLSFENDGILVDSQQPVERAVLRNLLV